MRFISPLRYPGGKAKIAGYIKLVLEQNLLLDGQYVEPYAGGASVALDLLLNEYVSTIHINDFDYTIYSFWHSVLNETEDLCKKINDTIVTVEEWKKQKKIHSDKKNHSILDVGFSTFFLNRVNRSGILKGGVIGGLNQKGVWKIDARFNKVNLIRRIQKIAIFRDRIKLYNEDALLLIKKLNKNLPKRTLFYLDPPYYNKGKALYINFYNHEDHKAISLLVKSLKNRHWIVSYDDVGPIKEMYKQFRQKTYLLNYSVTTPLKGSEVVVFSDKLNIPDVENPIDTNEIKKNYAFM